MDVELAAGGLLHVAGWPRDCLDAFGDHALAGLARTDDDAAYHERYHEVLEQERQRLWQLTADDPRFLRALILASPGAARRIARAGPGRAGPRDRRLRQAEWTLYRYLARAAGRATPFGLWSGIAELRFGAHRRVEPSAPRAVFTPALTPFQTLLRWLGQTPRYRDIGCWQLTPSLRDQTTGGWTFIRRDNRRCFSLCMLETTAILSIAIPELRKLPPMSLPALASRLAPLLTAHVRASLRDGPDTLRALLNRLVDAGVLLGGLDLPVRFEDPWDALQQSAALLRDAHRLAWDCTIESLHTLCDTLSDDLEAMPPDALAAALGTAATTIRHLAHRLGAPPLQLDEPALRCGLVAPWRVCVDGEQAARLRRAIHDGEQIWIGELSPATALRRHERQRLHQQIENGRSLTESAQAFRSDPYCLTAWPQPSYCIDDELARRVRRLQACLTATRDTIVLQADPHGLEQEVAPAPLGCCHVMLVEGAGLVLRGLSDTPAQSIAPAGRLLGETRALAWLRTQLRRIGARHGIEFAELRMPFEHNPDALAGAGITQRYVAPWSADPGGINLVNAQLRPGKNAGELLLEPADGAPRLSIVAPSAADLAGADPLGSLLLATGYGERWPGHQAPSKLPVAEELETPRFTPRLCLPGGALLRPRRSLITGSRLRALIRARGADRFRLWQHLSATLGWPALLHLAFDDAEPLTLRRDSPLALEAAFKGATDARVLAVEEAESKPWIRDARGAGYVAEIALPYARSRRGSAGATISPARAPTS
ncbi:MAG: lantibiotic dehydratase, partial [Gammaproteobacteria bacterium]|nr:lantibiotic dehydratase [Gammaproteobacteria bacterium]